MCSRAVYIDRVSILFIPEIGFLPLILPRYYERSPLEFNFDTVNTSLAGLGIGLLATAAISLAPTVADLPIAGAQVVRQAFRLGVLVDEVSQNFQPRDLTDESTPDTWAYVLPDVKAEEVQQELDAIHKHDVSPSCHRDLIMRY